ncbi:MAG: S49 family peptidase [Candidatus Kapaibacterium sp.]
MTHRILVAAALLLISTGRLSAQEQPFPDYRSLSELEMSAPAALRYGLYGFSNPALLAPLEGSDLEFIWTDGGGDWNSFNRWGLFAGMPNLGFGVIHDKTGGFSVTDYRISVAGGDRSGGFGIGYGWSSGDDDSTLERRSHMTLGLLSRPNHYLSVGLSGAFAFSGGGRNGTVEIAARPLGNEILTLFGDATWREKDNFGDAAWSAGAVVEPLPGIRLTGRYFDTEVLSVGLGFSLGGLGLGSTTTFDSDFNRASTTYSIRSGQYDRNIFRGMSERHRYLTIDLKGGMAYRPFLLFDGRRRLQSTLDEIDAAREDETIAGIAINTSGMTINREMLSELRTALARFKASGKYVVIYFDNASIDTYHFISVADKVVMDPIGSIEMRGYASGRSYYKEMFDKLGIGFEEIRLFKYKSAVENFARSEMSEGEREQRERMVDVLYELARDDISASRQISRDEFDRIVEDVALLRGDEAMDLGLVDTLARWDAVRGIMDRLGPNQPVGSGSLARYQLPTDDRWGEPEIIAILYAEGVCAMDEGINARTLSRQVDAVANDDDVKAVILRVDSPGGDGLASDLVAEALKRCSKRKPTIISQGYVAASGGYWLSMYGDVIVSSPNSITGSIGVIAGWLYDKGAFDSIGTNFDFVARGSHADLAYGPSLPLIDVSLPHRNLSEKERKIIDDDIRAYYEGFVRKVADGREMTYDEVAEIAQGRVWMGVDAKRLGLVDTLGGLDLAIAIARDRAGISPEEEVKFVELPSPSLFNPSILQPSLVSLLGGEIVEKKWTLIDDLRFRAEQNGKPIPMMSEEFKIQE